MVLAAVYTFDLPRFFFVRVVLLLGYEHKPLSETGVKALDTN